MDGGTGRRRAQSRTTIIILTCNGKNMKQKKEITLLRVIPTMTFIHFLTGKSSGILSDISSDILFGILSGISSGI